MKITWWLPMGESTWRGPAGRQEGGKVPQMLSPGTFSLPSQGLRGPERERDGLKTGQPVGFHCRSAFQGCLTFALDCLL